MAFDDVPNRVLGQKAFSFEGKTYLVKRFVFDSSEDDDASALFFLDGYGIVAIKSIDWGSYMLVDRGYAHGTYILNSLNDDRSEFFGAIPRGENWSSKE